MGLYDSVVVECPNCTTEIEFQSKAGECLLDKFDEQTVPATVACDIAGEQEECPKCGTRLEAFLLIKPRLAFREIKR